MGPRAARVSCEQLGIACGASGGSQPRGLHTPHRREPGTAHSRTCPRARAARRAAICVPSAREPSRVSPFPLTCGALSVLKAAGFYRELSQHRVGDLYVG